MLSLILLVHATMAMEVCSLKVKPEAGLMVGLTKDDIEASYGSASASESASENFYGGYGRVWLGSVNSRFVVAPQIKYMKYSSFSDANIQFGALVGYNTSFGLTPYVGASYSIFIWRL
ncbi:hypothetical protein [Helicobacter sp. WB40]|uniref:hypothetical protein n=1 Tax=Helicobacter sp. WB40 TaxID=3004130 RepID=UPI0022EBD849|nr:hypothetical protein [Helicobacter sp. WB40]MDA3966718.1 hypothetical protein [Helicobacter sp. WB40]